MKDLEDNTVESFWVTRELEFADQSECVQECLEQNLSIALRLHFGKDKIGVGCRERAVNEAGVFAQFYEMRAIHLSLCRTPCSKRCKRNEDLVQVILP